MEQIIQFIKDNPAFIIGNIISFIAVAFTFISYQVNSRKKVLFILCISACISAISFLILGAWTGFAMNIVSILRNIAYSNKDKKIFSGKYIPFIFAAIMVCFGIATWTHWYCILSVTGLVINTLALSLGSAQLIRKSILVTSPMVLLYDLLAGNIVEAIKELIAIISSVIGIIRFRKESKKEKTAA